MRLGDRNEGNLSGACLSSGRVLSILEAGNTGRGLDGGWRRLLEHHLENTEFEVSLRHPST